MHRIDTVGNELGKFTTGNPQLGQRATRLGADWPNEVQEEIISVITHAGLVPTKGVVTQLRDAITAIATAIATAIGGGGGGGGGVAPTRQVNGGGLLTGGGPLSADLTISLAKALSADIITGTLDTAAITPLQLATAIGDGASGFIRLPGGTILQRASGFVAGNSTAIISLPTTFASQCYWAGVQGGRDDFGQEENNPHVNGTGTSTVSVFNAVNQGVNLTVLAWGK